MSVKRKVRVCVVNSPPIISMRGFTRNRSALTGRPCWPVGEHASSRSVRPCPVPAGHPGTNIIGHPTIQSNQTASTGRRDMRSAELPPVRPCEAPVPGADTAGLLVTHNKNAQSAGNNIRSDTGACSRIRAAPARPDREVRSLQSARPTIWDRQTRRNIKLRWFPGPEAQSHEAQGLLVLALPEEP
jgi:hypothetical protein